MAALHFVMVSQLRGHTPSMQPLGMNTVLRGRCCMAESIHPPWDTKLVLGGEGAITQHLVP